MKEMSAVKRATIAAVCVALCTVLPMAFHSVGGPAAGRMLLPMHIPVFLAGLICGWPYGLACGLMGPVISHLISAMPSAAGLPGMMIELSTYGVISGVLIRVVHTKHIYADLYICLLAAIVCGRIVGALVDILLFFVFQVGEVSAALLVSSYVVTSLPGTAILLIFVPTLVFTLMKARLIPERYPKRRIKLQAESI